MSLQNTQLTTMMSQLESMKTKKEMKSFAKELGIDLQKNLKKKEMKSLLLEHLESLKEEEEEVEVSEVEVSEDEVSEDEGEEMEEYGQDEDGNIIYRDVKGDLYDTEGNQVESDESSEVEVETDSLYF